MFSNLPMLAILRGVRKQKAFDKDSEIACHVVEGQEGKEISLAETGCAWPCIRPTSSRLSSRLPMKEREPRCQHRGKTTS
jgi:hypothetical protein